MNWIIAVVRFIAFISFGVFVWFVHTVFRLYTLNKQVSVAVGWVYIALDQVAAKRFSEQRLKESTQYGALLTRQLL
jgi:hypothetical protein